MRGSVKRRGIFYLSYEDLYNKSELVKKVMKNVITYEARMTDFAYHVKYYAESDLFPLVREGERAPELEPCFGYGKSLYFRRVKED